MCFSLYSAKRAYADYQTVTGSSLLQTPRLTEIIQIERTTLCADRHRNYLLRFLSLGLEPNSRHISQHPTHSNYYYIVPLQVAFVFLCHHIVLWRWQHRMAMNSFA